MKQAKQDKNMSKSRISMRIILTTMMIISLIASTVILVAKNANAIDYTAPGNVNFRITLVNQDPDAVEPGGSVDARFKIENIGTRRADNPVFEIIPTAPLSVPDAEAVKKTGSIGGFQTGDDAVIVKFRLNVDAKANKGVGKVKLRYKYDDKSPEVEVGPFDIAISSSKAILIVRDVFISPQIVSPGKSFNVNAAVKNTADSYVKNIRIKLDISSATTPFAPINSTNEKAIEVLESQESTSVQFVLTAAPDATANLYKLPIKISYYDSDGKNYSSEYITGITVGDPPQIESIMQSTTICGLNQQGSVKIKTYNKDNINVKFLEITLRQNSAYELTGPDKIYVGKLDSDDYEEAEYTLTLKENIEKLPLIVSFKDSNNNQYIHNTDIPFKMCTKESKRKYNKELYAGGGILLLLLALYLILGRRKKK